MVVVPGDPLIDFRNFMARAWQVNNIPPPTRLQYYVGREMQHGDNALAVLCFRGFAKSLIGTTRGNHLLYVDQERKFLNVSAANPKAIESSTYMLNLIRAMPELKHLLPRRDQRQSTQMFDVNGATQAHAASVRSLGILSNSVVGARSDFILADDVESTENSLSMTMRDRVHKKNRELGGAVLRSADDFPPDQPPKIIHLGTPQVENSLYWRLEKEGHKVLIIPARYPSEEMQEIYAHRLAPILLEDLEKNEDLRGKPTEPTRFGERELKMREERYGPHGWMLQFMLSPTLAETNRFPICLEDIIVTDVDHDEAPEKMHWSHSHIVDDLPCPGLTGQMWHGPNPTFDGKMVPYMDSVMAVDPSSGGRDEIAYVVLKIINSQVFLLDVGGYTKGDSEQTMERLAKIARSFGVRNIVCEKNFGMGIWGQLFRPYLAKVYPNCHLEPEGIHVTGKKNERICNTLEWIVSAHRLIVSRRAIENDIRTAEVWGAQEDCEAHQLFYQLAHITRDADSLKDIDDRADALALGIKYFEDALDRDFTIEMQEREADELDEHIQQWHDQIFTRGEPQYRDHFAQPNWMNA